MAPAGGLSQRSEPVIGWAEGLDRLGLIDPTEWEDRKPPDIQWMVEGCFARGSVAILAGDGGLGKSLLMQQLCTAVSTGQRWLGLETMPARAMAVFCEDDKDELWRRQDRINQHYGSTMGSIAECFRPMTRAGQENALMTFEKFSDEPKFTPFWHVLKGAIDHLQADLVIIDTVADVFTGNEINRTQVRRFITHLRRLAIKIQGCVILTQHPSNTGMASGSGRAGSNAWHNSVRSRLYLTSRAMPAGMESDGTERFLQTMKNNYGPYGGKIGLRWKDGVFIRTDDNLGYPINVVDRLEADNLIRSGLRFLVENGTMVRSDTTSRAGLAHLIPQLPDSTGLSWQYVASAQERLVADASIKRVTLGSPPRVYLRCPDQCYPGETRPLL